MTEVAILSAAESDALARYEATIEAGLASFMQTGTALLHINDERLYRETHATFEDYLSERWHISRPRGYELMNAAKAVAELSAIADTPEIANEGQARAIGAVLKADGPERAAEVLREVAEAGPITAKAITAHVTQTTRTTEATKVEQVVDLDTGEILNGTVTSEVWEAEQRPTVEDMFANDPDVRAANVRANFSKWLTGAHGLYLFSPTEIADIAPDMAERIHRVAANVAQFAAEFDGATSKPTPLHIIKEA